MGSHYLSKLFSPNSIAIIGASDRQNSVGEVIFRNLLESGFKGGLYPVNPSHNTVLDKKAYTSISDIGQQVDLAVICTPAASIPAIIEECGKRGVHNAVVLSAGFREGGPKGAAIEKDMLQKAKDHKVRIIGPNCLGIIHTSIGLNATFFRGPVNEGNLALVSQSGALCTAILDFASAHDIGFSQVISMGTSADVDFGDVLDYLATDPQTHSILVYIEGIHKARHFMSALRAAARRKPVFVVKVGRHPVGSKAALSHTGALVGADDVFDAALRRAGAVRVMTLGNLFSAAKSLSSNYQFSGNRLAIITNGGGPGVMAIDRAADLGVAVAQLSEETIEKLNQALPATWSHNNPVDIIGDATPERYRVAVSLCMNDPGVDGVLVILTPQAMTEPLAVAEAMVDLSEQFRLPLLTCWMGEVQVEPARQAFIKAKILTCRTPETAVEVFSYITSYHHNQRQLAQTPEPLSHQDKPDIEGARLLIESVLADQRNVLTEMESKALLSAFRIPVAATFISRSPSEALLIAQEIGFPVVMKINSTNITHKSDVGGVRLNLSNAQAVRSAYNEIIEDVRRFRPDAEIDGITIQPMLVKPNGRELMLGVTTDPVFGPVITFAAGGTTVEVMGDRAVALPPLNAFLAKDLINRTRISRILGAFRQMPPIQAEALESMLLRVSEMVCELPWLREMDINPLIVDENGALAADARVVIDAATASDDRYSHLAVYPYPTHLVEDWQLPDGTPITIRPIRAEDAEIVVNFVRGLSEETKYFRFLNRMKDLPHEMLVRFTQIDYDREMALIAVITENAKEEEIGVCRYSINPDGETCEFALVISDKWQHRHIGHKLMSNLMNAARQKGLKVIEGEVLVSNHSMQKLVTSLGFSVANDEEDHTLMKVRKLL